MSLSRVLIQTNRYYIKKKCHFDELAKTWYFTFPKLSSSTKTTLSFSAEDNRKLRRCASLWRNHSDRIFFVEMTEYKIVRLLTEHIPGATEVLRQSFFPDEKFCNCVRILQDSDEIRTDSKYKVTKASKELEDLGFDAVKDGVSLCAVDTRTGEVLGVAINKIQVKPNAGKPCYLEHYAKQHIKEPSAQAFVDLMLNVDSRYNLFGEDGNCYFEILYLSVRSTHKGKGVGTALVAASAKLGQEMKFKNSGMNPLIDVKSDAKEFSGSPALNMSPKCVSAIFTSRFSQRCGRRAGYEEILLVPYTEFSYNGKNYSEVTGPDHPHCTLSVKNFV